MKTTEIYVNMRTEICVNMNYKHKLIFLKYPNYVTSITKKIKIYEHAQKCEIGIQSQKWNSFDKQSHKKSFEICYNESCSNVLSRFFVYVLIFLNDVFVSSSF